MRKDLVSNLTNLGFNTSLATDQLCDLDLKQVESQCFLLHRAARRIKKNS